VLEDNASSDQWHRRVKACLVAAFAYLAIVCLAVLALFELKRWGSPLTPSTAGALRNALMMHAASAVVSAYRGKIAFVNFIQDVVPLCDCIAGSGKPVVQDVGITFSLDPVAIDRASFDLVDKSPIIPGSTSVKPPDILGKMHDTSSLIQLQTAEKLKMGSMKYELVSI